MYLIDTSVWILTLRKNASEELQSSVREWIEDNVVITSGIIRVELFQGCRNERELQQLSDGMDGLISIGLTGHQYSDLAIKSFELRRRGITVPVPDLIIAMQAKISNSILVHADSHYEKIKAAFDIETLNYLT
jgi:predicted nucleic acid-binding protein